MKHFIKKTIKGALAFTLLFPTTSKPIIVPQFPDEFVKVPDATKLERLSVGKTNVWGVSSDKQTYRCQIGAAGKKFELVTREPKLTDISVGYDDEEKPWGIGPNGAPHEYAKKKWTKKSGTLTQISVGQTKLYYIWGVNAKGDLYYWGKKFLATGWNGYNRPKLPDNKTAPLQHVSCGYDQDLWVIGKDDSVWRRNKSKADWIKVEGALRQVEVGNQNYIVGTNNANTAFQYNKTNNKWEFIGSNIKYISINLDGEIWLITKKMEVYWSNIKKVTDIRSAISLAIKAKNDAQKALEEAKKNLEEAQQEAERRTEEAKKLAETAKVAAEEVQKEFDKAEKAFNKTEEAKKTLNSTAAKKAAEETKIAAKNAQIAAQTVKDTLDEIKKTVVVAKRKPRVRERERQPREKPRESHVRAIKPVKEKPKTPPKRRRTLIRRK